ncbi:glycosyltransferase family 2 protein [Flavobacterium sp. ANB]|uniref:glycosyltransferase family A protein n=1 Tax=unclassified Flavobacterium TaxID=196869 RepID=UPI00188A5BD1|nr:MULTISPECIES: glycosyltransferase family A protein [unclassified Flavobacterium]MBF4516291.1 glycosyltransferase family 2 protein [Flavobacterium sp. ANB]
MKDKLENFFKETDVEILISTMNRDSLDFLVPMFPFSHFSNFSILIVNQTLNDKILTSDFSNVRVINSFGKGLSKSRNLALENAIGKILVIADDDIVYQEGFITKIIHAYHKFPEAAVINFSVVNSEGNLIKKYPLNPKSSLNIFDILNTSSIEITLNKSIIHAEKIQFDEKFGLGGIFEIGEEAVFLFDLKEKKRQLAFESEIIAKHENQTSSNKKNIAERYYIHGALFSRVFKKKYVYWILIKLFFDLKQHKISFSDIKNLFKSAKQGHKEFERTQL